MITASLRGGVGRMAGNLHRRNQHINVLRGTQAMFAKMSSSKHRWYLLGFFGYPRKFLKLVFLIVSLTLAYAFITCAPNLSQSSSPGPQNSEKIIQVTKLHHFRSKRDEFIYDMQWML